MHSRSAAAPRKGIYQIMPSCTTIPHERNTRIKECLSSSGFCGFSAKANWRNDPYGINTVWHKTVAQIPHERNARMRKNTLFIPSFAAFPPKQIGGMIPLPDKHSIGTILFRKFPLKLNARMKEYSFILGVLRFFRQSKLAELSLRIKSRTSFARMILIHCHAPH